MPRCVYGIHVFTVFLQYTQYNIVVAILERGYLHPLDKWLCPVVEHNLYTHNKNQHDETFIMELDSKLV